MIGLCKTFYIKKYRIVTFRTNFSETMDHVVIHSHDGAADDIMALLLLLKHDVIATVLTPADSHLGPALQMTKQILAHHKPEVPCILNDVEPPNSFPDTWRDESIPVSEILGQKLGEDLTSSIKTQTMSDLVSIIQKETRPIIFIETGPLTALSHLLTLDQSIADKIETVIWTGGSFTIDTSCPPDRCDGSQTWNAYIDPISEDKVWSTDLKIVLLTREVTSKGILAGKLYNNLPDTKAGNIYKEVYRYYVEQSFYRLWDVMTAVYYECPEIFTSCLVPTKIVVDGEKRGCTLKHDDGKTITAVIDIDYDRFVYHLHKSLH